jgi:hypothetical protein
LRNFHPKNSPFIGGYFLIIGFEALYFLSRSLMASSKRLPIDLLSSMERYFTSLTRAGQEIG